MRLVRSETESKWKSDHSWPTLQVKPLDLEKMCLVAQSNTVDHPRYEDLALNTTLKLLSLAAHAIA